MAPVYEEITLEWNGKEYCITPTYGTIQKIEQSISLAHLLDMVVNERAPTSQLADLLSAALRAAGCMDKDASAAAIHSEMYSAEHHLKLTVAATKVLMALLPEMMTKENPTPPETEGKPKAAEKSKASSGPSITKSQSDTSESSPQSSGK